MSATRSYISGVNVLTCDQSKVVQLERFLQSAGVTYMLPSVGLGKQGEKRKRQTWNLHVDIEFAKRTLQRSLSIFEEI
jgi:hypothetical protein